MLERRAVTLKRHVLLLKRRVFPLKRHIIPLKWHVRPLKRHILPLKRHVLPLKRHILPLKRHGVLLKRRVVLLKRRVVLLKRHVLPLKRHVVLLKRHDVFELAMSACTSFHTLTRGDLPFSLDQSVIESYTHLPIMKIIVIGASRGTGALAVRAALDKGHDVTAFSRNPKKLELEHPKLTRRAGDFHAASDMNDAIAGHEAVIVTASVTKLSEFKANPNYISQGTKLAIDAMKSCGAKRIAVLSALGTGDSKPLLGFVLRTVMVDWLLKAPFEDHVRQERLLAESGLEWVSARPGRLTDGPAKRAYQAKSELEHVPAAISRADVADFLVRACEESTWVNHAVQLGG